MAGNDTIWLPVAPSFRGFGAAMVRESVGAARQAGTRLNSELSRSGQAAGQAAGQGVADGMRASAGAIAKASTTVAQARKRESDAAASVMLAEAKLTDARDRGASAEVVARQEAALEQARRRQSSAASQLASAESDMQSIRDGGQGRAQAIIRTEAQLEKARLAAADAADKVSLAEAKVAELQARGTATATQTAQAQADLLRARSAQAAATDILAAKEALYAATLEDVERQAREAASATEEAGRSADEAGGFMSSAADKAKGLALAFGVAAGAAFAMGADVAGQISTMNDQLGLTGAAAQQLGDEVGQVLRSGVAGGVEEAAGAVGALTSQFSYLGFEGEKTAAELSRNFLGFTNTFDMEMAETTQTVGQLIQNGLAGDVTEGVDLLTAAFQRVPQAMREELPEILNEYGANFTGLGFTGEQAFGLLVGAAEKGKFVLDKTGDALKEFQIRGSDMSKSSSEAYAAIGLSAEDMAKKIAMGGPGAQDALQQTARGLLAMEDPAARANTAIALFGSPLEDMSIDQIPQFLDSLTGADSAMGGFAGSSEALAQSVEQSLGGRINALKGTVADLAGQGFMLLWDTIQNKIIPAFQTAGDWIQRNEAWVGPLAVAIGAAAAAWGLWTGAILLWQGITKVAAAVQAGFNAVMAANPIMLVVIAVAALVAGLVYFVTQTELGQQVWDTLVSAFATGWQWVKDAFASAWAVIQPILDGIWQAMKVVGAVVSAVILGVILVTWNVLSAYLTFVWNSVIKPVFEAIKVGLGLLGSFFAWVWTSVIQPIWTALGAGISFIWTTVIQPVWEALKLGLSAVGSFFQWVWTALIQPVWNALGAGISFVWDTLIRPVWDGMKIALGALGTFFQWVWNSVIKPAWDGLGVGIRFVIDSVIRPAFDGVKSALQSVGDFFGTIVDGIKSTWDQLKGHVARPINWVIDVGWNRGLVPAWNTIAGFLPGLPKASPLSPVAFAEGGPVPLTSGATRGKDSVHALMMPNEHVLDVDNVKNAGGHGEVYKMRGMIDAGQPFTWIDGRVVPAGHGLEPQRFAEGGAVKGASLSPSPGEGGLQPIAVLAKRLIHRIWPDITSIGGYRQDAYPEHPSGRALDVMVGVGNPAGDEVTGWALANDHILPLIHALWKQTVWMPGGATQPMGDRGSPTQNHMDHPHLWYQPKAVDPSVVPEGLVGHDGLNRDDRMGVVKEKIGEILDKALDPIREGMTSVIGSPPPELLGIPPRALDETKTAAVDGAFSFVENIAGDLKDVYNQAKDVVTSITGLFRDEGGYIPNGKSIVNNETGKPEAVFNWKQVEDFRRILESAKDLDHLWAILGEFGHLSTTGEYRGRMHGLTGMDEDHELVKSIVSMREMFQEGLGELQATMGQVVQAAGVKARKGYESELLDFFGVKGLTDSVTGVWDAFNPTTSPATAQAAGGAGGAATAAVASGITGTAGAADTGLTYGNPNLTYETKEVALETKMPTLSEPGTAGSGPVADQVREAMAPHGWDKGAEWEALSWIIDHESSWNPTAQNPTSTAYGLFQFLDTTWAGTGIGKSDNPKVQADAGAAYIKGRYGTPTKAKAFWEANNWYDQGGIANGMGFMAKATLRPERVLDPDQTAAFESWMDSGAAASAIDASHWQSIDGLLGSLPSAAEFERIAALADTRPDDAPAPRQSGPLVVIEKLEARNEDEAMRAASREARRLVRSTGLVGGWRD